MHSKITEEKITMHYISDFKDKEDFINKLKKNREVDRQRGYTSVGLHRDDFKIYINSEDVSIYGSQGQNRTAILSLKLTEMEIIHEDVGEYPIMLLDDFMSELDEKRISNFLESIKNIQVIITCTKNIDIKNAQSHKVVGGIVEA